jgi:DoxX-like family
MSGIHDRQRNHVLRRQVDPVWPATLLAGAQFVDAVLCAVPAPFVTQCLDDVGFPPRYRFVIAPIKAAAGAGLVGGIVVPGLGALTGGALVAYFFLAVGMHVRAGDLGRNLVSASGLLVAAGAVTACFLRRRPGRS